MFRKKLLLPIFFIILFIIVFSIIKEPIKQTFEYDLDEGFELIKSSLFLKGFPLYRKIYSDHPPLHTVAQSYWFKLFGPSVYQGRILILLFSCVFLWAFYRTIKNLWGGLCASVAVIFLLLSSLFLKLGISIMIGTVSLSLAMLSIYCITLYRESRKKYLLILSGVSFALSLQAKLITAFLIPLIVLEIIQAKWISLSDKRKLSHFFPPLLLWFGSLLSVSLVFIALFFHFNFPLIIQLLIQPHLKKIIVPGFNFFLIWQILLTDYDIALLALIGIILLIKQRKWQFLFPILWLGSALAALAIYRPILEPYYLLVSIPICWLAAISFSQFFAGTRRTGIFFRWLTATIIILTILKIPSKYNRMSESIWVETTPEEHKIVDLLLKYKKNIHWIFTDRPIFAFYAAMLVPPELAVISDKTDFTDHAGQDYWIDKLEKYKPEIVLLSELKYFSSSAMSYINKNYSIIYQPKIFRYEYISIPGYIYWNPKYIIFLGRIWHYKVPLLRLGYKYKQQMEFKEGEMKFYIRKNLLKTIEFKDLYGFNK